MENVGNCRIIYTTHVADRMIEREISQDDIITTLKNGIVVDVKINKMSNSCCLILGKTKRKGYLHVAVEISDDVIVIITAYRVNAKIKRDDLRKIKETQNEM